MEEGEEEAGTRSRGEGMEAVVGEPDEKEGSKGGKERREVGVGRDSARGCRDLGRFGLFSGRKAEAMVCKAKEGKVG